jgi:hypothetical protein
MLKKFPIRFDGAVAGLAQIAAVAGAFALLAAPGSSSARVAGLYCAPMAGPHDRITRAGGSWVELTPDQLEFARGVWATMPAAHARLPLGHKAFLSKGGNEPADSVYFVDDDAICARMFVSRGLAEQIVEVGAGMITHSGDSS